MRIALLLAPLLIAAAPAADRADSWWRHVQILADDAMEGREAGTDGHRRASDYVAARLAEYGLEPAGDDGTYFQAVTLEERTIQAARSRAALVREHRTAPLAVPGDILFRLAATPPPERVDAELVFVGYGFHLPEAGHDDLAGLDLRGRIAVFVDGEPPNLSGALKSHARAERGRLFASRGAVGMIQLSAPDEAAWRRLAATYGGPGMYPAEPAMRRIGTPFFQAYLNPSVADRLLGAPVAALVERARRGETLPRIDFSGRLTATIASDSRPVATRNVVARLPGRDRRLRGEHVLLTAHLDHLGIGAPVNGDRIYNGALDNAAGSAALLDIAQELRRTRARPRRSLLFVFVTGEEKGLVGSRWFAQRPSVPRASIVADLNYDMALPLFPLTGVTVLGADESSLGADARAAGASLGLPVMPDPFPERDSFIRSDQYAFIEAGIPALAFKFGFRPGTPEAETERAWRANIYHSPQDDLSQTVFRQDEIRLHDFMAAIALRVADAPARPRWNGDSFFRRFAR
ncbi:MAG TPA: M28 family metallopeptidase [Allosphingosinicella sp.]|nr:M28 family metallopeptidase [Allosphingosinicella sp.]